MWFTFLLYRTIGFVRPMWLHQWLYKMFFEDVDDDIPTDE